MTLENQIIHRSGGEDPIDRKYSHVAPDYDSRWSFYIQATIRETVKRLDLQDSDRLLDIGCGTASLFQAIASRYPSVELVGVDLSPAMLKVAYKKLDDQAVFLAAPAQSLPIRSNSFDIVVSCNAFHYWREPEECLTEAARVLKPSGKIVITDWCDDYIACRFCNYFLRIFSRAHFKTYGRSECERLFRVAGFRNIQIERYKINWLWGLMTAQGQTHTA
ncbi:MAG: class I SAM-dependent methyltransferase [Deltaproteobacteria bacterium]|jgi:ubiquinone/menaquinone biosynthesis C-methylase UbiE|nr:class I SAM-dependent methyltransferase [Deltaproteobacteria bacterium]